MKLLVAGAMTLLAAAQMTSAATAANDATFRAKIQPLLQKHCGSCHSGAAAQSGLSLASLDDLMKGGKHGPAIHPGDSRKSILIQYVRGDKSPRMPLGGHLAEEEANALAAAIDEMKPLAGADAPVDAHAAWLLHAPKPAGVPQVRNSTWVRNPIDAFVLASLEAKGLTPAPPADRRALIRRVYFDLVGLPPPPEAVSEFVNSTAPDAYEQVIDKLLASERYGERWGRHWLDLVRFAESDGFAIDGERPTAWRYRDYVIRSFNADKPYNQFVMEQIAGDEMERGGAPEARSERLVALGFLRMGTWEADANFKTQLRQDFLNEITGTTSSVFLGLTAGCARCHDHKYDPIPQRDFYRLQAFFAATRIDERAAPFQNAEDPKRMRQFMRQYEDEIEIAEQEAKEIENKLKQKYIAAKNLKPDDKAAADFEKVIRDKKDPLYTAAERNAITDARLELRRVTEAALRYRPVAYSASDLTPPHVPSLPDTFVLSGGDLANKGEKVEPGFLQCLTGKLEPAVIPFSGGSSGRRRALAEWIASADNPLTARVAVNRIWQHHFGEGIVRTPGDFGKNGDRPSHPELLDWLAAQFIESKWSIKSMHRLMLTSNTYRQATAHPDWKKYSEADSGNRLLWRMNWLRLESEVLRDSILALSGRLRTEPGGPGVFFDVPSDVAEGFEFFKWFPSDEQQQLRRTVYAFQRRSVMMPMMEVFDGANMSESCSRRNVTTVAPQAFTLLNGQLTNTEARHFANRVIELAGPDRDRQIEKAFMLALARKPAPPENEKAGALFANASSVDALTRLGVVLFNLNEFLYLE
jgi:hypothetical protein